MGRNRIAAAQLALLREWANSSSASALAGKSPPLTSVGSNSRVTRFRFSGGCSRDGPSWPRRRSGAPICRAFSVTVRAYSPEWNSQGGGSTAPDLLPIDKILVANRGEIACRVMRTARRLGIKTVAVFSDADETAKHVRMADEAVRIGPAPATLSYLNGPAIVAAARATNAQAIHPGYGFLSENVQFAELCQQQGVTFIGPPSSAIHAMGDKSVAKNLMSKAGVPIIPGYHGAEQSVEVLREEARRIGYPVLIKATQGGGGKGMRIVESENDFAESLSSAQREALAAFGNGQVLIEKYLSRPRHIEVQIFGDKHGNVVHLFERDCSLQRRHQKIIEEAPAPGVTEDFRKEIGLAAVDAAKEVGYESAGTVEFIFDTLSGQFYFMEMNTRLQVEHPITEMITDLDLVEWQINVANGASLPLRQHEIKLLGHAFEARIYAENVPRDFLPAAGTLHHYCPPPVSKSVRVETGVGEGDAVSVYYDPMIAKLVTWGSDRSVALSKLYDCLSNFQIAGPPNNIPFLKAVAKHPAFGAGQVETGFIENHRSELLPGLKGVSQELSDAAFQDERVVKRAAVLAAVGLCLPSSSTLQRKTEQESRWNDTDGFRLNHLYSRPIQLEWKSDTVDNFSLPIDTTVTYHKNSTFVVQVQDEEPLTVRAHGQMLGSGTGNLLLDIDGISAPASFVQFFQGRVSNVHLWQKDKHFHFTVPLQSFDDDEDFEMQGLDIARGKSESSKRLGAVTAPMAGRVVKLLVEDGAYVKNGTSLLVLEAMKMEHIVKAPTEGLIEKSHVVVGQQVGDSSVLFQMKVST